MKKRIIIFLLLSSVANAQEEQTTVGNTQEIQNEIYDKRVSVYLHPYTVLSLLNLLDETMFFGASLYDTTNYLYATIEIPLSLLYSLIIRPSYLDGLIPIKSEIQFLSSDCYYGKRLGSDFGIRYYTNKKGKGFYLQGQMGLFYYNEKEYEATGFWHYEYNTYDKNYMWFDVMGYIGKVWQFGDRFRMFFDAGLGYAIIGGSGYPTRDINLGVGIKIGKNKK